MKKLGKAKGPSLLDTYLEKAQQAHAQAQFTSAIAYYQQALRIAPDLAAIHANLGVLYQSTGQLEESLSCYLKAIRLESSNPQFHYNLAGVLKETGQLDQACLHYRDALRFQPNYPQAQNNLGSVLQVQGQLETARACYRKALELRSDYAYAWFNLGSLDQQQQRWDEAITHYRHALALQPEWPIAYEHLAEVLHHQGKFSEARDIYHDLLTLQPTEAKYYFSLANTYQRLGNVETAIDYYQQTLQLKPEWAEVYRSLGSAMMVQGDYRAAVQYYQQALQCRPDYPEAENQLGNAWKELGQMEAALEHYEKAQQFHPTDANRIRLATVLPPIYNSPADLLFWRERIENQVQALGQQNLMIADPLTEVGSTNFYMAYQGLNDRVLQCQIAQLYRASLPEVVPFGNPRGTSKKRIGLVSSFFYNHTICHYYASLIAAFPREAFEIYLFAVPGMRHDEMTAQLASQVTALEPLPRDLAESRKRIAAQALDILIYTDIGMEPFTYFLAFTRLAHQQYVLAGHPVTTGIPTIDTFISHELTELPEAQAHYSEKLVRLPGLPAHYARPVLPEYPKSRADLGFSAQAHLYVCPMTLFKIHPDFDLALAAILEQDPAGEVLLFRYQKTTLHELLQARFQQTILKVADRIHFLPWADSDTFLSILMQADVLLDTFHFGGGSTNFICLATGTPLVTWPSPYLRGRSGYAFYQWMGVHDAIATSQDHYAELAVNLATDADYREDLKQRILENNGVLFNNDEGVLTMIDFLRKDSHALQ